MKKILIAVGALVLVGGAGAAAMAGRGKSAGREVRSETVARRDLVATVTASGKIQPKRKVDISADVSGRVIQLPLEEGQWVNRGDLLLRIDPSQYEASVQQAQAGVLQNRAREAQARAQLLKAQADERRAVQLSQGRDLISAQEVDNARTQSQVAQAELQAARFAVNQAQALLAQAQDNLRKTTIAAPMSGRVVRLNIHEGETAIIGTMNNPGSLLLTIADPSAMEAKVKVDETDVPGIQVGDSTTLRIDAFPDQTFTGKVTRIGNSAVQTAASQAGGDQQAVDYEVVVTLDHPPADLRPDLSTTAEIITDTRRQALSVPIIALTVRDRAGKKFKSGADQEKGGEEQPAQPAARNEGRRVQDEVQGVFIIRDAKAVWTPVTVGITGGEYFEVTRGLKGGEAIVAGTFQAVRDLEDGDAVRVPPAPPATARGQAKGGRR